MSDNVAEAVGGQVFRGRGTYGEPRVVRFGDLTNLHIGNFCSLGEATIFLGGGHRTDWITTYPFPAFWESAKSFPGHRPTKGDVNIGHDVWVGSGVTILSGVRIGNGAAIAACALITKDVPPYAIVGGNPSKVLRYRFPPHEIACLERIRWWDWSDAQIEAAMQHLLAGDVAALHHYAVANNLTPDVALERPTQKKSFDSSAFASGIRRLFRLNPS